MVSSRSSICTNPPRWMAIGRRSGAFLALLLISSVVIGCGGPSDSSIAFGPSGDRPYSREPELVEGPSEPPIPFVAGLKLVDRQATRGLAAPSGAGLMGWMAPLAVPSPDGDLVAYNAWEMLVDFDPQTAPSSQGIKVGDPIARPSIRLFDQSSDEDSLLEAGAFSLAWHPSGRMAYFKGSEEEVRLNENYDGQIMVREDLSAPAVPWTLEAGKYIVVAWAQDSLIAYREGEGGQKDLLRLDGPGQVETLASGSEFIALSPDGSRMLVNFELVGSASFARLIEVGTGQTLADLDLSQQTDPETGAPFAYLGYSGSWSGDLVVVPSGPGLVVLDTSQDSLRLEGVLRFGNTFPRGLIEPQFLGSSPERVIAASTLPPRASTSPGFTHVYIDCDLTDFRCVVGAPRQERDFHPVYNPSRP